jgi:hypothetical protein
MEPSPLAGWDNFFVITGSSAAGLTGLTFIVITLAAEARRVNPHGLRAFMTPTIVHFGAVLGLAAFMSMPRLSVLSLSLSFAAGGLAGLVYVGAIAVSIRRVVGDYVPVHEDWIWNAILPALAYGTLLAAAFLIWRWPRPSLYGVAAVSVLLMFIGIHNAWDIAVWNSLRDGKNAPKDPEI